MQKFSISVEINEQIYLRNPLDTILGRSILSHSINLLQEIGFEDFNFKKLAQKMHSTEASIYRYFENKYKLLAYLIAWYWENVHFMIEVNTKNIKKPKERLNIIVDTIVRLPYSELIPEYIDILNLQRVIVENGTKLFHIRNVDEMNKDGYFFNVKRLVETISETLVAVDPEFKYPNALATNILELSMNNEFYILHLPRLTDVKNDFSLDAKEETIQMIIYYLDRLLLKNH